jgi:hypothetical protein
MTCCRSAPAGPGNLPGKNPRWAAASWPRSGVSARERPPGRYHIRIRDRLDAAWSDWFDSLLIVQEDGGVTTLTGPLLDRVALFGWLARLNDPGATPLTAEHLPHEHPRG